MTSSARAQRLLLGEHIGQRQIALRASRTRSKQAVEDGARAQTGDRRPTAAGIPVNKIGGAFLLSD